MSLLAYSLGGAAVSASDFRSEEEEVEEQEMAATKIHALFRGIHDREVVGSIPGRSAVKAPM